MLLPLGIEDAKVHRLPVVSIAIAAICVMVQLFSSGSDDAAQSALAPVVNEWRQHPYLQEPPALDGLIRDQGGQLFAGLAAQMARPPADVMASEQARLDADAEAARTRYEATGLRRFGLVPARGVAQPGWLAHMFMHLGLLHLLGNMFFLYLVGPLLEDAWGRPLFAGFYLVGGLVAALAQVLPSPGSQIVMVGASGAVAACMGAFAVRFARRKVRVGYFFWIIRFLYGTFLVPAWLWLGFWFLEEAASAVLTPDSGVAFLAHVGGFGFGALFTAGLMATGIERRLAPLVEGTYSWTSNPALEEASQALSGGDRTGARKTLQVALARSPDDPDVMLAMARLDVEDGRPEAGADCEKLLAHHLRANDDEALKQVALDLGAPMAALIRPTVAYRAAMAVGDGPVALALFARGVAAGGPMGARAAVRAAELALAAGDAVSARAHLDAVKADAPQEVLARAAEVGAAAAVPLPPDRFAPIDLGHPPPHVLYCRILELHDDRVRLHGADGKDMLVPFAAVQRLGAALIEAMPARDGIRKDVLVADLVLDAGDLEKPARTLRVAGSGLGPEAPAMLAALIERVGQGARRPVVPRHAPGRFADLASYEDAVYG